MRFLKLRDLVWVWDYVIHRFWKRSSDYDSFVPHNKIPFRFAYPEYDTHCWDCGQEKRLENDARCWSCNRSKWVRCDKCMKRGSPVICDQFTGGYAGHFTCKKCFFKDPTNTVESWVEAIIGHDEEHWIWPIEAYDEEIAGVVIK